MRKNSINQKLFVLMLALVMIPIVVPAQQQDTDPAIKLESYDIVQLKLRKPFVAKDLEGKLQKYEQGFLVTLKGAFPRNRAEAMDLFIGEYRVPEYGGTKDGLYFKLYDPNLVKRLEGMEFRYRYLTDEIRSFRAPFSLRRFQPLRVVEEK